MKDITGHTILLIAVASLLTLSRPHFKEEST